MQVRITIHWPGGGDYEASVDADDPVLDDIGVTATDREEMSRGGSITKSAASDPAQLLINYCQKIGATDPRDTASKICRNFAEAYQDALSDAALDNDERLEAGKI